MQEAIENKKDPGIEDQPLVNLQEVVSKRTLFFSRWGLLLFILVIAIGIGASYFIRYNDPIQYKFRLQAPNGDSLSSTNTIEAIVDSPRIAIDRSVIGKPAILYVGRQDKPGAIQLKARFQSATDTSHGKPAIVSLVIDNPDYDSLRHIVGGQQKAYISFPRRSRVTHKIAEIVNNSLFRL